ncbi:Uncharacterized protein OS=Neosynechococcus sphagnicola sy1 GN=DO97_13785 PE=4 SV=1: DUF3108 [Gemmata massiliana]|uniref:DUF3108 domain-containing protein n=1 Tax=Gemmata massiliana TaxID=1210884 RepID=A0A6P2D6Q6_9BACT|nr:hypothetical protein [Gemmata massiliana]VTR96146.1 Uncharacterized protein OS=Neosynechococcus sphagnicola sy1 GN=DO97_13785 PE=4 SV=1: DUF3108 [Gemmata massiliana]
MARLLITLPTFVAFIALAPAAPVPPAQKPVLYYPTSVGAKRVYEWGGNNRTEQVTAVDEKDGKTIVTVGVLVDEKVTPYCKILVSDKGLFFGVDGLEETKFPYPMLKLPAKAGDRWDWEVAEVARKVICTVGAVEEVEVPAGKFQTIRVESEAPVGKTGTQKTTQWYAPNMGWVKMVTRAGNAEETRVLKSFTLGK